MLEGPFNSNRWSERIQSIEGVFLIVTAVAAFGSLIYFAYELAVAGSFIKFTTLVVGVAILGTLAVRVSSLLSLLLLVALIVAVTLWP
jgi:hypothetical protein